MTELDPNKIAPNWPEQPWWRRCRTAVLLLSVHGFITDAESQRAYRKIEAWEKEMEAKDEP